MFLTRSSLPALAFAFCFVVSLCAQSIAPTEPKAQPVPQSAVTPSGRINLDVVVTDAAGKPVSGLAPQDFTLLDNDHAQKIISFHASDRATAKADPPVEIILVFDTVNNGFADLAITREGVEKFLRQNGGHLVQPVSLILFNSAGLPMQSQTSTDGNALAETLRKIKPSNRPTGGDPPFVKSLQALVQIAQRELNRPGRKMLVWLGKGWELSLPDPKTPVFTSEDERNRLLNFHAIVSLSTMLREARVTLYGGYANGAFLYRGFLKGAKTAGQVDNSMLSLDVLALQSGGRGQTMFNDPDTDLADQIDNVVAETSTFYTLTFDPPHTDQINEYHDLKVLIGKPGLKARTNTGYYNQPEYAVKPQSESGAMQKSEASDSSKASIVAFTAQPVTVEQLEQLVKDAQGRPDAELARRFAGLKLTERLSSKRLSSWATGLPGLKSKQALVALADVSAFLNLPVRELPPIAPPGIADQRSMVARAVDYLGKTIPRLPDFYATRTTTHYEDAREKPEQAGTVTATGQPSHTTGSSHVTVVYRDGKEIVDLGSTKDKKPNAEEIGLITKGTFGPILSVVMVDAAHSAMTFSHWEQGETGPQAVFRFTVPKKESHYEVAYRGTSVKDQSHRTFSSKRAITERLRSIPLAEPFFA